MTELRVRIDDEVFVELTDFYDYNLKKHPALDEETVLKKEHRLIQALQGLGKFATTNHKTPTFLPWVRKGYKDYYYEGFHFGYRIETLPSGERVVVVYEACHELLYK